MEIWQSLMGEESKSKGVNLKEIKVIAQLVRKIRYNPSSNRPCLNITPIFTNIDAMFVNIVAIFTEEFIATWKWEERKHQKKSRTTHYNVQFALIFKTNCVRNIISAKWYYGCALLRIAKFLFFSSVVKNVSATYG